MPFTFPTSDLTLQEEKLTLVECIAVSSRFDPSYSPHPYPAFPQTFLEALFGIGALISQFTAFLDAQKMLKPPSRPGQAAWTLPAPHCQGCGAAGGKCILLWLQH